MKREEADVCVIGTGAAGGVMLQELTAAGFSVLALQQGPFLQASDFQDDELATIVRDQQFSRGVVETYRVTAEDQAVVGRYSRTARCVGGTMARWGGWAWRYRPDEFRVRSTEGEVEGANLADWPFDYAELEPFYARAEADFAVAGDSRLNPFAAERAGGYPFPAHPLRPGARQLGLAAQMLELHPYPLPVAINVEPAGRRGLCIYGGNCWGHGCPVHAKGSTLSVGLPRALATGRLDLRPNASAFEITVDAKGRARSVRYHDWKGREQEVLASIVVLAGNGVGSPHLLLLSTSKAFPDGLANSSGQVGRNLMVQMNPVVGLLLEEPALPSAGHAGHIAIDDFHLSDSSRGFIRGGVIAETNAWNAQPLRYVETLPGERWGAGFKKWLATMPRSVFLTAVLEDLPVESNRVDLDPDVRDERGMPVPRITRRQHANDLAMHAWFREKLLQIATRTGAEERWTVERPGETTIDEAHSMPGGFAALGTCRMGEDPESSVVDRRCHAHDVPNLWVVDGSTFPTAGGYAPGLTILANAYRAAAHLIEEAKRS